MLIQHLVTEQMQWASVSSSHDQLQGCRGRRREDFHVGLDFIEVCLVCIMYITYNMKCASDVSM